jgi:hypothetical protein
MPRPPDSRAPTHPWPTWPNIFRVSSAHEEGGERLLDFDRALFRRRARPRDDTPRVRSEDGDQGRTHGVRAGSWKRVRAEGGSGVAGDGLSRPRTPHHARAVRRPDDGAGHGRAGRATPGKRCVGPGYRPRARWIMCEEAVDSEPGNRTSRHSTQKPQNSQNKTVFSVGSARSALIVVAGTECCPDWSAAL